MQLYLACLLVSAVVSGLLTWGVRHFARRYALTRPPELSRHIHRSPIPRLGGLAIFASFIVVFLLYLVFADQGWMTGPTNGNIARVLMLATGIFLIGLIDDLIGVRPLLKLAVEIVAGLGLYLSGIHFDFSPIHLAGSYTSLVCVFTTVGWVVLVCNAINLIDGVDGLAAGAALFSMVTVFTVAIGIRPGVAHSVVILAGTLFGFLIYNFNPASIFMGDSGSLFVGFLLSAFVLAEQPDNSSNFHSLLVPIVCFALPLTDVALSLLRRFLNGHSLFGADREHIHHKLMDLGLSQRQVVAILYAISALFSILSLFLLHPSPVVLLPVIAVCFLTLFFGIRKLRYHEFSEVLRPRESSLLRKKRLANNIAIRKSAAVLQVTRDPKTIAMLLETSLINEFDGFAVDFSEDFLREHRVPRPWASRSLSVHWGHSQERLTINVDLNSYDGSIIGELQLFHDARTPFLVRMELIRGLLRSSLITALQNSFPSISGGRLSLSATDGNQPTSVIRQHLDYKN